MFCNLAAFWGNHIKQKCTDKFSRFFLTEYVSHYNLPPARSLLPVVWFQHLLSGQISLMGSHGYDLSKWWEKSAGIQGKASWRWETCAKDHLHQRPFFFTFAKLMWFASISLQHGCHKQRFLKFPDFSPDKCKFSVTNHKLVLEMDSNLSSQPFLYSFSHVKSCSWYMNIDSSSTICAIKDWLSWKPNIRFVIQFHEQYFYWCNMIHVHKMYKRILGVTKQ